MGEEEWVVKCYKLIGLRGECYKLIGLRCIVTNELAEGELLQINWLEG